MRKKLALIFLLAVAFVLLLVFRPWEAGDERGPRFFDRLPDADIIGKSDILDLSRTLASSTYHYRVPYREFLTGEFILGQGKAFGVDVQKPVFFFANEKDWMIDDFGAMFIVSDSALVSKGIEKLDKLIDLKDTVVYNQTVYKQPNEHLYFAYGSDWLLVYHGDNFKRIYHDVLFARRNEIPPSWRTFLNYEHPESSSIIAKAASKNLESYGVESVLFTIENDSTTITLNAQVRQFDSLSFQLKKSGYAYVSQEYTRTLANVNMDMKKLRTTPDDPIVKLMKSIGAKISFPVHDLLNAWEGDIAFRQGGIQLMQEKYIESELDENFNITEVVKYKTVKVPGYSIYLSVNDKSDVLIKRLLDKGILTKEESRYRILFSPPMNMAHNDSSLVFYTGRYLPVPEKDETNKIVFTNDRTRYSIFLDSTGIKTIYGRLQIPLDYIIEENITSDIRQ